MTIVIPGVSLASGRTFRELQDEVLSDDFTDRDFAKRAINDALADIARQTHEPLLEATYTLTTVKGTASYSQPTDMVRLLAIVDPQRSWMLDDVGVQAIDELVVSQGRPTVFAQYAGKFLLAPTPDGVYSLTVRYSAQAGYLSDDNSAVIGTIPDEYAYMVVAFARARAFAKEDDVQMAQFWRGEYERDLLRLKADVGRRDASRVRRVPGMWHTRRPVTFREP
jgi:hypothetical protein